MFDDEDGRDYVATRNLDGVWALWPADRQPPQGWVPMTAPAEKAVCLAAIERLWLTARPGRATLRDQSPVEANRFAP